MCLFKFFFIVYKVCCVTPSRLQFFFCFLSSMPIIHYVHILFEYYVGKGFYYITLCCNDVIKLYSYAVLTIEHLHRLCEWQHSNRSFCYFFFFFFTFFRYGLVFLIITLGTLVEKVFSNGFFFFLFLFIF